MKAMPTFLLTYQAVTLKRGSVSWEKLPCLWQSLLHIEACGDWRNCPPLVDLGLMIRRRRLYIQIIAEDLMSSLIAMESHYIWLLIRTLVKGGSGD